MIDPTRRALDDCQACLIRLTRDHAQLTSQMAGNHPRTNVGYGHDPAGAVEWTVVEAAALRRIASRAGQYQNLLEAACRALVEADKIRGAAISIDTTPLRLESRCDGWERPECEENGVQNVWIDGANHYLCSKCWGRYRVAKHRATA